MTYACNPGAGFRRFDDAAAGAQEAANAFCGLAADVGPSHALAAFKRAAGYLDVPARVVQLIDVLFAWTRSEDWRAERVPIVWPRNEKLARALGLKVRQVQNLLDRAVALRLITHKDSPSGHRGGIREADGSIKWAYGIVLSPIGARMAEFLSVAQRGSQEDQAIDILKRRLTAARRRTSSLAQTALDYGLAETGADEELALAQTAARHMRGVRDVGLLASYVEQIETRSQALEARVAARLAAMSPAPPTMGTIDNASADANECMRSTTTKQKPPAKAGTSSGFSKRSGGLPPTPEGQAATSVEADLDRHGVDPSFIEAAAPDLCGFQDIGGRSWGDIVHLADRLVSRHQIHRHAWFEATRLMGQRGAAAAVIATLQKYQIGEVERPGAYLRGMNDRAATGELNLGRTYHGLKESGRSAAMRSLRETGDARPIGEIARYALSQRLVLSGKASSSAPRTRPPR